MGRRHPPWQAHPRYRLLWLRGDPDAAPGSLSEARRQSQGSVGNTPSCGEGEGLDPGWGGRQGGVKGVRGLGAPPGEALQIERVNARRATP